MLLFDITAVGVIMAAIKRFFCLSFMEYVIRCQKGS
jgi:hypothetical protein